MKNTINVSTAIGFVIMSIMAMYFKIKIDSIEKREPEKIEEIKVAHSQTYLEDSLCRVWIDDTANRVAFKHWYNKQLNKHGK